jgi:putative aldouronate transport system substrate-binding protein
MAQVMPTLQSMETEVIIRVIMGESIDLFDQFVSDWYEMGGTEIVDEVNQWAAESP